MLRVSNGRRRRRLLIDVAIGSIRGAFVVGVFALISESPRTINISYIGLRIRELTHSGHKCRKAFGRHIFASRSYLERIIGYYNCKIGYLSLSARRAGGPGALAPLVLIAFSIALGTWRPLHKRAFRRHRPRFCHLALRARGKSRKKSDAAEAAGFFELCRAYSAV